jgi:hypothetical protein
VARQLGVALPPVDVIQVEDAYFVRDGHHRVSVARAMGQQEIEAEITAWQVEFPESWRRSGRLGFVKRPDGRGWRRRLSAQEIARAADGER